MNYKKRAISKICIICMYFLIILLASFVDIIPKAHAAKKDGWKKYKTGKIIDIDPMYEGEFGMMVHFNRAWVQIWKHNWEGTWPSIGEVGTLYKRKVNKANNFKWVEKKPTKKPKIKPKVKIKKVSEIKIQQEIIEWQNKLTTIPNIGKVVVVIFTDGKTSTAYLNNDKEWKLDINKDKYRGGKTIEHIIKWKDIGL